MPLREPMQGSIEGGGVCVCGKGGCVSKYCVTLVAKRGWAVGGAGVACI